MPTLTVSYRGVRHTAEAEVGETLLSALQRAGFRAVEAPCGGNGTCGKCLVAAAGALSPAGSRERALLLPGETRRLACRARVLGDCTAVLEDPDAGAVVAASGSQLSFPLDPPAGRKGLGLAIDVGTTTVAARLYCLETGAVLGTAGGMNRQRAFGADVISRIQYGIAHPEGLLQMSGAIRDQIAGYARALCAEAGRAPDELRSYVVAANTVMEHILAGLSPASIATAPFTPLSLFGTSLPASDLGLPGAPEAELYLAPAAAGYVGGDVTAGLLACGACRAEQPVLFLDVGTNGEMALGNRAGFTTCAAAAGPAFEGAEISRGMSGAAGAVSRVWLEEGALRFSVLGGGSPKGICGSGLIDALAVMLELGAVDDTGRLLDVDEAAAAARPYLGEDGDGPLFWLDRASGLAVTAADVRKLQLAKAAVAAGIRTLLEDRGMDEADVSALYLAGGFGSYIRRESAGAIGLLPQSLLSRTAGVGNTALTGAAAVLLSRAARAELEDLQGRCAYLELSTHPRFSGHFIDCMTFAPD